MSFTSKGTSTPSPGMSSETFLQRTAVVWKTALGSLVAWEAAVATTSKHPYLAPLTLILCLQNTIGQSLRFAWYRTVGTVIGVLLIGLFAKQIPVSAWSLAAVLFILCSLLKVFRLNDMFIHQVALSILFVLYFEQHSQGYAWDRAKDTLIGSITAVVFLFIAAPKSELKKASDSLKTFVNQLADAVGSFSEAVLQDDVSTGRFDAASMIRTLNTELQKIHQAILQAKQVPFQSIVKQPKLNRLEKQFESLQRAYTHFASLLGVFCTNITLEERDVWSKRLDAAATEIRKFPDEIKLESNLPLRKPQLHANALPSNVATILLNQMMAALRSDTDGDIPGYSDEPRRQKTSARP